MALESQSQVTGLTLILKYRITTPDAQGRGGLGIAEQEDGRASEVAERAGGPYQANPFSPEESGSGGSVAHPGDRASGSPRSSWHQPYGISARSSDSFFTGNVYSWP